LPMNVLLHSCCGPCLGGVYPALNIEEPTQRFVPFWDNFNIHPYVEYQSRLDSFKTLIASLKIEALFGKTGYGLERFLKELNGNHGSSRCRICYKIRLEETATRAKSESFEAFSTTLLISPYQNQEWLYEIGNEIAKTNGLTFYFRDLRNYFRDTYSAAKTYGLYRQKYCGCIFSEFERFSSSNRKKQRVPTY